MVPWFLFSDDDSWPQKKTHGQNKGTKTGRGTLFFNSKLHFRNVWVFQYVPDVTFHKAFIVINSSETLFRHKTKSFPTCFGPCCDIDQTVEGRLTPAPPKKVVVVDWHETLGIDGRVAAENEAALEKLLERCEVHIVSYVESYRWQKQLWDDVLELKCSSLLAGVHCCWRPDVTLQMLCTGSGCV